MKKRLYIFIPLLLAVTVFICGCGNDDNKDDTTAGSVSLTDTVENTETKTDGTGKMEWNESDDEDTADFNALFG